MFLQQIVNGLTVGAIYALIALGYSMVYGILKIVNFAHGDILMFGSFIGLILVQHFRIPLFLAFCLSALLTAVLGMLVERFAYRPLRFSDRIVSMISALGVSTFLSNFAQILWGTERHPFQVSFGTRIFSVKGTTFSEIQLLILILSFLLMLCLYLFTKKSMLGAAMRATSMSITNASLMGINTDYIISLAFAIGSALASCAGIMISIYYNAVYPTMGYMAGLKAFTAAVLGGIGSIPGAMLGGLILGIIENTAGAYLSTRYQDLIAFLVLIIVLIIKPTGLMGSKEIDKV